MSSFWERVHGHLSAGSRVFVACVAEHTRGSPGTAGAKLLVSDSGELFGTIGGGAMEHRLVEQARGRCCRATTIGRRSTPWYIARQPPARHPA